MSRANSKMCQIHDLQGRGDIMLTKKDCDLIYEALFIAYVDNQHGENPNHELAVNIANYFKNLTRINH